MLSSGRAKNVSEAIGLLDPEKARVAPEGRSSGEAAIPGEKGVGPQEGSLPPVAPGDGSVPPLEKEAIPIDAHSNRRVEVLIDPADGRRFDEMVRHHGYSLSIEETMRNSFKHTSILFVEIRLTSCHVKNRDMPLGKY
jgi:hypothetical protein